MPVLSVDQVLAFGLASFVFVLVAGPSVVFVVGRGLALGRRAAIATVLGNAAGVYVHIILVAGGLGALLARSAVLLEAVRLVGAAYLVWLGFQAWRHRCDQAAIDADGHTPMALTRIAREGFVVGLGNPKSVVFFAAVLPQFVDPGRADVPLQMLLLGLITVAVAVVSDSMYGVLAGSARAWLSGSPRRLERLGGAGGLAMIGLGLGLAASGRPDR